MDQAPFRTAQQLAQMADTPEEQELAKDALRLSDYELDLSFVIALQDAEAHPPDLSVAAKEIQVRLQKAQKLQQALQAQVDQLTAQIAKAPAEPSKDELQDQLDLAKAGLDVANNDVEDGKRDLTDAGGNLRDRIEKMKQSHEAADKLRDKSAATVPDGKRGPVGNYSPSATVDHSQNKNGIVATGQSRCRKSGWRADGTAQHTSGTD